MVIISIYEDFGGGKCQLTFVGWFYRSEVVIAKLIKPRIVELWY